MEQCFSMGGEGGRLRVRESGGQVETQVCRGDDGRGLYKAYLLGRQGSIPLGALLPEGGKLCLSRSFSVQELERRGVWPPTGGRVGLAFPFDRESGAGRAGDRLLPPEWKREHRPGEALGEELLRRSAEGLGCVFLRRGEAGFALAAPWRPDREFPLTPLFCFAKVWEQGGRRWAVFQFDSRGFPLMPEEEKKSAPTGMENSSSCEGTY